MSRSAWVAALVVLLGSAAAKAQPDEGERAAEPAEEGEEAAEAREAGGGEEASDSEAEGGDDGTEGGEPSDREEVNVAGETVDDESAETSLPADEPMDPNVEEPSRDEGGSFGDEPFFEEEEPFFEDEEAEFSEEEIEVPDIASEDVETDELLDMVDELELTWGGRVQSDIRFRLQDKSVGRWYDRRELPVGVARNENILGLRLTAEYGDVTAKADVDFVLYGAVTNVEGINDLYRRERTQPFRFDVHRLYVQMKDLVVDGFDLTVGQQLVLWGVGDQFNPTNNINPDDVEDVLLFGDQQGNMMIKGDYWITDEWQINGVVVPVFRPALLPRTAPVALALVDRVPIVDEFLRRRIVAEQEAAASELVRQPTVVENVNVITPDTSIENVQLGYRIAGVVLGQDVSASYYYGRTDFPVPFLNHTVQDPTEAGCNPVDPNDCVDGLLETTTYLWYPRMHVYGFNMAGEIGWLSELSEAINAIGYRAEIALVVPSKATLQIVNERLELGVRNEPAGEYDYDDDGEPGGPLPVVVEDRPFAKWTLGLDYTFNEHVYANLQWVHGLVDEYGAGDWIGGSDVLRQATVDTDPSTTSVECALPGDGTTCVREITKPRLGDYAVLGLDFTMLEQKLLLRLFTIWDLAGYRESYWDASLGRRVSEHHSLFSEKGFSAVIYPEANYNFGNGLDVGLGALVQLGKRYTKFGDPAAGGTIAWGRTRFSF